MCQVKFINGLARRPATLLEAFHQYQQSAQAAFVPGALQQLVHHIERGILVFPRHPTDIGNHDAQKAIAFAILPLAGLEESGQVFALHGVDVGFEFLPDAGSKLFHKLFL